MVVKCGPPETGTGDISQGTGVPVSPGQLVRAPKANSPASSSPQHTVPPSVRMAHTWSPPTLRLRYVPPPATETGTYRSSVVPSPTKASPFMPQHQAAPAGVSAHVVRFPASTVA